MAGLAGAKQAGLSTSRQNWKLSRITTAAMREHPHRGPLGRRRGVVKYCVDGAPVRQNRASFFSWADISLTKSSRREADVAAQVVTTARHKAQGECRWQPRDRQLVKMGRWRDGGAWAASAWAEASEPSRGRRISALMARSHLSGGITSAAVIVPLDNRASKQYDMTPSHNHDRSSRNREWQ